MIFPWELKSFERKYYLLKQEKTEHQEMIKLKTNKVLIILLLKIIIVKDTQYTLRGI